MRDLTRLPEWSDFFRAALLWNRLHFRWHEEGQWVARAYEITNLPVVLSEGRAPEKFEALRLAVERCGREVNPAVWEAFYAFRSAATGTAGNIEDLL
ncbi:MULTISPECIES: hypothetical protein [unclassified Sphingopyxis]|uniref:hypothetical protein n=1 Tax=unclassified Sphingopyxis TaxID=2614943 RepID=UPI0028647D26|nr:MULTISPECIES: hypothetical protein [unclassified Sphingopyxis]MDR7061993.1 hypothetical protein [Sphingopyxis sp. BE235]MDR7182452.1 hypothetical protein [Sphingopyxis sp. BE249]